MNGEVDDDFIANLSELSSKLQFIATSSAASVAQSTGDVLPVLENLRAKAVAKAREYLLARIYSLRRPKTNVSIIQHNVLLKFTPVMAFVQQHGPEVYKEVRYSYIDTLSRVLSTHLRQYLADLERLLDVAANKESLMTQDESSEGLSVRAMFTAKARGSTKTDPLSVRERAQLLRQPDAAPLLP